MKIILDTNVWISYLLSNNLLWIDGLFESNDFELLFSNKLFSEFLEVTQRPKIKKYFSKKKLELLISRFEEYGLVVNPISKIQKCRDPNDDFLLELAIDGNADYLITGDKDLLVLKNIRLCQIITLLELHQILKIKK